MQPRLHRRSDPFSHYMQKGLWKMGAYHLEIER